MEQWKKNLFVLWFGNFFVFCGMTMIMPFLTLYLQSELNVTDTHEVAIWAGLIFSVNFLSSFISQPIWGKIADKTGRKAMLLRSSFGMAIVIILMGFATSPWQLLILRFLNGMISGFNPAAVALVSTSTPKSKLGFAMGTLQSGGIAGTILGPLIGGFLADSIGFRPIFYITGACILIASLLVLVIVKDNFDKQSAAKQPVMSVTEGFKKIIKIPSLASLLAVTILIQFATMSPMNLMPLYIQELNPLLTNIAFTAGLVSSLAGISNMLASPLLGRLGDKIGSQKILVICLFGTALSFIPQALATSITALAISRFVMGIFIGGLIPTVNSLIGRFSPKGMESRAYSFNTSALALGNLIAPTVGGVVSGFIGLAGLFWISASLMLINACWVYFSLIQKKTIFYKDRQ